MKVSLVWSSPTPERTIAIAMRRCYSTKPIEEIEAELDQKGPEYWKYLLAKALEDKSLDVIEHFAMTLALDDADGAEVGALAISFPYLRFLRLSPDSWLLTMNARTLIEMWRTKSGRAFAEAVVAVLDQLGVCPVLLPLAFGERVSAS